MSASSWTMYKSGLFCGYGLDGRAKKGIFLFDGPWGHSEELKHVTWLFSSAACVLVSIVAVQIVWRRFRHEIVVSDKRFHLR